MAILLSAFGHFKSKSPRIRGLADRKPSAGSWGWEYVLWLNMGEKIRKGEWDPTKDPIPDGISEMPAYAKQKRIGLRAHGSIVALCCKSLLTGKAL